MNARSRKIVAVSLIFSMLTISGCSMGGGKQVNTSDKQVSKGVEPYGKYSEPVVIKTIGFSNSPRKYPNGDSVNNNVWTRAYEEELGIKLDYLWFADGYSNYEQKLNIAIASNNLPDIFPVPREKFVQLSKNGMLEDLTEAFNVTIPEIKSIFERHPDVVDTFKYDGKWVGFSSIPDVPSNILWVRTDWLKKLGLTEPKTMDELLNVAEAFVKRDPDGNGKDDTLGLPLNKDLEGFDAFAAGYKGYMDIWLKDAGRNNLVYGTVQPQIKMALSKMSELYKAGIIDKEYGVKNRAAVNTDIGAGKFGLYYGAYYSPIMPLEAAKKNNPQSDWKPIFLPSVDGVPAAGTANGAPASYMVVKKGFKNPEALFKMVNLSFKHLFSENAQLKYHTAEDGTEVHPYTFLKVDYPNGGLGFKQTVNEKIKDAVLKGKNFEESGLNEIQRSSYEKVMKYKNGDDSAWAFAHVYGEGSGMDIHEQYVTNKYYKVNEFYGPNGPAFYEKSPNLYKLKAEVFSQIIMGGRPVSDFDEFVRNWHTMGGDEIVKEVNEWYRSKKKE